jgi:hypothetical protein
LARQDAPKENCFDACRGPFFDLGKTQNPSSFIGQKQSGNVALDQRSLSRTCAFPWDLLARKKGKISSSFVTEGGNRVGQKERDKLPVADSTGQLRIEIASFSMGLRMTSQTDPTDMSRDERISELACILAQGVARLEAAKCPPGKVSEKEPSSSPSEP